MHLPIYYKVFQNIAPNPALQELRVNELKILVILFVTMKWGILPHLDGPLLSQFRRHLALMNAASLPFLVQHARHQGLILGMQL